LSTKPIIRVLRVALLAASILPLAVKKGVVFSAATELTVTVTAGALLVFFSSEALPQLVNARTVDKNRLVYSSFILNIFLFVDFWFGWSPPAPKGGGRDFFRFIF
jgi:hypothetical protein